MKVHRIYNDNGTLLRYTVIKEMNTRALRYKKQNNHAQLIDTIQRASVLLATMTVLVAVYLINN